MKQVLTEKSLSRTLAHMQSHDCGMVTAYRGTLTHRENQARNRVLLAMIQNGGYGVTSMEGVYIENYNTPEALPVGEHSFFVVDLKDRGDLKRDIVMFGRYGASEGLEQDSVLFLPKGGNRGILIGTREDAWPGLGKEMILGAPKFGIGGEFHTKVGNRPFQFESTIKEYPQPSGQFGHLACRKVAESDWKEMLR